MGDSPGESAGNSRRYSIEELLRLRTSASFVLLNLDNLSPEAETSTILNLPEQARENPSFRIRTSELVNMRKRGPLVERPSNNSTRRRGGSQSLMASGFDEDEDRVIYRGHPLRRDIRETQWQLRRRGTSDRSSQPVDAPTDILAQKDDNFKAFFQAVRSPTHVRVTAGGRIVPNTRAHPPPQPVFKWNHEQHFFEQPKRQTSPEGQSSVLYQEGVNIPHAGIFPAAGLPYFGGQPAMQTSRVASGNNATENTPMQLSTTAPAAAGETSASSQSITSHQGIQISPPENFDLTRPYWFHDRWVFPQGPEASQHQHLLPVNLAGNHGIMHPVYGYMPGTFAPHAGPQGMFFPPPNPTMSMNQPGQPYAYPPMMYPASQPLGNIANGMPVQPATSGMPLFAPQLVQYVDDPKQRLARCREDLKKIENDLENNAHQIDKPSKLAQRSLCLAEVQRLEAVINHSAIKQNHLATSASILSKNTVRKSSSLGLKDESSDRHSQKPAIADSNATISDLASLAKDNSAPKSANQPAENEPQNGPREQYEVSPQVDASSVQDKSRNRAKLAAAAATAVFQPRSHQLPKLQTGEQKDKHSGFATTGMPKKSQDDKEKEITEERRLLANAFDWSIPPRMMGQTNMGSAAPYTHTIPPRARHNESVALPKMYPYAAGTQVPAAPRAMMPSHMTATPYLRGIQSLGNGEYTYERQLTEDERRARCLYWGKAPRELQRGLPKYNGRDFFPPSPVKALAKPSQPIEASSQAQISDPFRDIDYSRINKGLKDDGNNEDTASHNSWGGEIDSKLKNKDLSPAHTLPRMKASKREDGNRLAENSRVSAEEDQSTVASDRPSIDLGKRNPAESKHSSSSFLQGMLKNPRYTSSYGTSSDAKEVSSDSLSGKSQSFEDRIRLPVQSNAASMAPPLSGTITSATAKGLLPQYHGSATASLTPNSETPDTFGSKLFARFTSNSDAQEQQSPPRVSKNDENRTAPSRLAAAEYLRSLANKEQREDHKASSTLPSSLASENSNKGGGS